MKKQKFYAVAGVNGYGVFDSYDGALSAKMYLAKFNTKRFEDFELAKEWAEDAFYDRQECFSYYDYEIGEIKKLNWVYYKKKR